MRGSLRARGPSRGRVAERRERAAAAVGCRWIEHNAASRDADRYRPDGAAAWNFELRHIYARMLCKYVSDARQP